jgi:hypothetical protein
MRDQQNLVHIAPFPRQTGACRPPLFFDDTILPVAGKEGAGFVAQLALDPAGIERRARAGEGCIGDETRPGPLDAGIRL